MATITINGREIECMSYVFAKMELDLDSGRNLNGIMERNVLAHHPRKITVKFPPMGSSEMVSLLAALDNSTLTVNAFNPFTGIQETMTMYHGDLIPEIYWNGVNPATNQQEILYKEFQVELVEY